MGKEK